MATTRTRSSDALTIVLRVAVVVALGVSAYAHLKLAKDYNHPAGGWIRQNRIFQIQGAVAILTALIVALTARLTSWLGALSVLGGSLVAVLLYRYNNVGVLGPLPDMTDMTWTSTDNLKVVSVYAEAIGTAAVVIGLLRVKLRRG